MAIEVDLSGIPRIGGAVWFTLLYILPQAAENLQKVRTTSDRTESRQ